MPERLQKILAQAGYGSRHASEEFIFAGRVLFRLEHPVKPAQHNERQNRISVLVCLECAAQDVVRYLPDEVCFFSEVVGSQ